MTSQPPVDPDALSRQLDELARAGRTATYQEVARALSLEPPQTIFRLTKALEYSMSGDADTGRPLRAAVVVSRTGNGQPATGFFVHARQLGCYDGPDRGPLARRFHADELERVFAAAREGGE
ncbi:MAG: hypothetical protein WD382_07900 [Halofilum sp. (in: g-proteobacteria)]